MSAASSCTTSIPNRSEARFCLFLCGNDGRFTQDFGDPQTSGRALVPGTVLPELTGRERMLDFLAKVEAGVAAPGCEMTIDREGTTGTLVMRGTQTPYGTLVFAALPASIGEITEAMSRGELERRHDDAVAQFAGLVKHGEDTARILTKTVHDLKNPISSIVGSCEYLTQYCEKDPMAEHLDMISSIEASARMLLHLSGRLAQLCGLGAPAVSDEYADLPVNPNEIDCDSNLP